MPCGIATPVTWDDRGRMLFTLIVRGTKLSGRWIVQDRRFVEASTDR
jgi:hypothetical protein